MATVVTARAAGGPESTAVTTKADALADSCQFTGKVEAVDVVVPMSSAGNVTVSIGTAASAPAAPVLNAAGFWTVFPGTSLTIWERTSDGPPLVKVIGPTGAVYQLVGIRR